MNVERLKNFLPVGYHEAINAIATLWGIRSHMQTVFDDHEKLWEQKKYEFLAISLIADDITGPDDNGWILNFPMSKKTYLVKENNYKPTIAMLRQRECAFTVLQSHEHVVHLVKTLAIEISFLKEGRYNSFFYGRCSQQYFRSRKAADQDYFEFLYTSIPELDIALSSNYLGVDLKSAIRVLKFVRDKAAHTSLGFNDDDYHYNNLPDDVTTEAILKYWFKIVQGNPRHNLIIDDTTTEVVLKLYSRVIFQIAKQVASHFNILKDFYKLAKIKVPSARKN